MKRVVGMPAVQTDAVRYLHTQLFRRGSGAGAAFAAHVLRIYGVHRDAIEPRLIDAWPGISVPAMN